MGDYAILPTNDSTLETIFTCTDYPKVISDNDIYVDQAASGEHAIFLWKDKNTDNKDVIIGQWKGKSTRATTASTVYLQIYNKIDDVWETLDSNNSTAINTEFVLYGTQSINLDEYYDIDYWVSFRVYQKAI